MVLEGSNGPFEPTSISGDLRDPRPPMENKVEPKALIFEQNQMEIAKLLNLPEDAGITDIKSAIAQLQENKG